MPPVRVHFNGSVNLPTAESVMREIAQRVPRGVDRVPDGEPGERRGWISYHLHKFLQTPGLESADDYDLLPEGYNPMPQVRLSSGVSPEEISWPDLGYADAYIESFKTFTRLQQQQVIPEHARFQAQFPTPLASIASWFVQDDQEVVEPHYARALFADVQKLLDAVPHEKLAIQWDVAIEFHLLERVFKRTSHPTLESLATRLARAVEQVPPGVPVGLHLCYGDLGHRHFTEPQSLDTQVRVASEVSAQCLRPVNWFSFTVPQGQCHESFFEPLHQLRVWPGSALYFGLVPYHPAADALSLADKQLDILDKYLGGAATGSRRIDWGISTECGMGRVETDDVFTLLDLHRQILDLRS